MLGEFFQKMKVLRREVGAQSVNDHRIVDGVPDVVAVAGVCRRGADLQRDFDGLGDGLLARVNPDQCRNAEFVDEDDVHFCAVQVSVESQPVFAAGLGMAGSVECAFYLTVHF